MAAIDQLLAHTFHNPLVGSGGASGAPARVAVGRYSWERLYTFKEALVDCATRPGGRLKSKLDLPNGLPPAPIDELALELLGLGW